MSLDVQKLQKMVPLGNGGMRARCPACAEAGQDRSGEHLRVYPDGRFGCCVHPQDREHRKRIFALAGVRSARKEIKVRVARAVPPAPLGRLGRVFTIAGTITPKPDAADGQNELPLPTGETRTSRTAVAESETQLSAENSTTTEESRTLRTPFQNPYAYGEKKRLEEKEAYKLKGFGGVVRNVRVEVEEAEPPLEFEEGVRGVRMPHFGPDGTLIIPFSSPEKFHWWRGGQSIAETRAQLSKGEIHATEY